jgi:hypothetical protein
MNIVIDRSFDASYDCQVLDEIPNATGITYYFPDQPTRVGQDGIRLKISPRCRLAWAGLFLVPKCCYQRGKCRRELSRECRIRLR